MHRAKAGLGRVGPTTGVMSSTRSPVILDDRDGAREAGKVYGVTRIGGCAYHALNEAEMLAVLRA